MTPSSCNEKKRSCLYKALHYFCIYIWWQQKCG